MAEVPRIASIPSHLVFHHRTREPLRPKPANRAGNAYFAVHTTEPSSSRVSACSGTASHCASVLLRCGGDSACITGLRCDAGHPHMHPRRDETPRGKLFGLSPELTGLASLGECRDPLDSLRAPYIMGTLHRPKLPPRAPSRPSRVRPSFGLP